MFKGVTKNKQIVFSKLIASMIASSATRVMSLVILSFVLRVHLRNQKKKNKCVRHIWCRCAPHLIKLLVN